MSAAILLSLCALAAAASPDPLARQLASQRADGFEPVSRVSFAVGKGRKVEAVTLRHRSEGHERLRAWELRGRAARLVYLEMSPGTIALDAAHAQGAPLYGDGIPTLAYHVGRGSTLHVLRLVRFRPGRAEAEPLSLPSGSLEDLDGDGRLEVIARARPLGRAFTVECGPFAAVSQSAYRTVVYAPRAGELVRASAEHAAWFKARIERAESTLSSQDLGQARPGDFLGAAVSLYYDYAELGEPEEGWRHLSALLRPRPRDGAAAARCLDQVRGDLRRVLSVPG